MEQREHLVRGNVQVPGKLWLRAVSHNTQNKYIPTQPDIQIDSMNHTEKTIEYFDLPFPE